MQKKNGKDFLLLQKFSVHGESMQTVQSPYLYFVIQKRKQTVHFF